MKDERDEQASEISGVPRTRFGLARKSIFNTSFPINKYGEYSIFFLQFGLVPLTIHEKVPLEKIDDLVAAIPKGREPRQGKQLTPSLIRALLIDAEVALYHLAADYLASGSNDFNDELRTVVRKLADALDAVQGLCVADRKRFDLVVRYTVDRLAKPLGGTGPVEPALLRACLVETGPGTDMQGDEILNCMLEGFKDDWRRRTGRPIKYAITPGSAHHFYIWAIEMLAAYLPSEDGGVVRSMARQTLPTLHANFLKPWDKAIRRAGDEGKRRKSRNLAANP